MLIYNVFSHPLIPSHKPKKPTCTQTLYFQQLFSLLSNDKTHINHPLEAPKDKSIQIYRILMGFKR
ncbi:MAG: hypothetical protein COB98_11295 [Flavobacteriaceae bacterium]|nr:MAG: hypothetical protein COB98_11295 [Flavobacteriaceae bacterium]